MLIGYVSNEYHAAVHDVAVEFERDGKCRTVVRSTPQGGVHAELLPGEYRVTLAKDGYGAKTVAAVVDPARPCQFRLLSDSLYGYAWPKWVRSGQAAEFRVHSTEPYYLTLWRYGLTKELVQPIGWFDEHGPKPCTQILPDEDFTRGGVRWNRYGYTKKFKPDADDCLLRGADTSGCALMCLCASQLVKAPARSGLYYFHAETPSGRFLSFPWVVAPARPQARIAVLASTNTWNAYNNFGGRSNYINADRLPDRPTVNARLDLGRYNGDLRSVWQFPDEAYAPLSFDRPEPFNHIPKGTEVTDPIRGRQPCHLAEAEWRLLGWLEREGIAYDFYSDYQLHDGTLDLDAYDTLIISTHPEYWSRSQYQRVKSWVFGRGGKLMYLGGNGVDCEVEFPSGSAMRCLNWLPTPPGVPFTDPTTGRQIDCRMHRTEGTSPAELLGVVFTEAGCATSAPYRVTRANHWIYEGTGLKDGDAFGATSLHERCPGGASGHETDKITPHSPAGIEALARGTNDNNGGAEIVYHETKSGGAVFSVGSITWPASILVDPACSRITRNVLDRMLAGKAQTQPTGVSTIRS